MQYTLERPTLNVMSTHDHSTPSVIERHVDVAVVGGSAAGLATTLQLSRQCRSVIVIDSGEPRNAPADQMQMIMFFKNLGVAGAFLMIFAHGPGKLALDKA